MPLSSTGPSTNLVVTSVHEAHGQYSRNSLRTTSSCEPVSIRLFFTAVLLGRGDRQPSPEAMPPLPPALLRQGGGALKPMGRTRALILLALHAKIALPL